MRVREWGECDSPWRFLGLLTGFNPAPVGSGGVLAESFLREEDRPKDAGASGSTISLMDSRVRTNADRLQELCSDTMQVAKPTQVDSHRVNQSQNAGPIQSRSRTGGGRAGATV